MSMIRTRWAAIGAAVAISLGAGGIGLVSATVSSGERSVYTAITSCRLRDTRATEGIGGRTTPLTAGEEYRITTQSNAGECAGKIPADATGLALNVTALFASELTHLTFWPEGPVPNASSLNPSPGQPPTPNAVTTDIAADGSFYVRNNSGTVDILIDAVGYYQDHDHDDRYYTEAEVDALLAADLIPSGTTVTGYDQLFEDHDGTYIVYLPIELPGRAPVALTDATVQFGPDGSVSLNNADEDAACTGSYTAPTAPAGMLCIYIDALNDINTGTLYASVPSPEIVRDRFAQMRAVGATDGNTIRIIYTWAYTAP